MNLATLFFYGMAVAVVIAALKAGLDRVAIKLYRENMLGESFEYARISAFGLIVYSVMQDLKKPDEWLLLYWFVICCWFYVNNRGRALER